MVSRCMIHLYVVKVYDTLIWHFMTLRVRYLGVQISCVIETDLNNSTAIVSFGL
jgi:hypothetical protein